MILAKDLAQDGLIRILGKVISVFLKKLFAPPLLVNSDAPNFYSNPAFSEFTRRGLGGEEQGTQTAIVFHALNLFVIDAVFLTQVFPSPPAPLPTNSESVGSGGEPFSSEFAGRGEQKFCCAKSEVILPAILSLSCVFVCRLRPSPRRVK